jgi:hypothetical protein
MIVHMFPDNAQQERRLIGVLVVSAVGTFAGFILYVTSSQKTEHYQDETFEILTSTCLNL